MAAKRISFISFDCAGNLRAFCRLKPNIIANRAARHYSVLSLSSSRAKRLELYGNQQKQYLRTDNSNFTEHCNVKTKRNLAPDATATCGEFHQIEETTGRTIKLHYEKRGTGENVLLLIPGALGCAATDFGPQLNGGLDLDKYTIVCVDPQGYGESRPPERCFGTEMFLRDAAYADYVMKKLGYEKYSVLGWSDGGIVGMIMAARFSDSVNKLVVWGANAYIGEEDMDLYETVRNIDLWSPRMRQTMVDKYEEDNFRRLWNQWLDTIALIKYGSTGGKICTDALPAIACPTLILHGAKDKMCPLSHAYFLKENIHNSRLVTFTDGGHNIHVKHAQEFNENVSRFLDG